MTQPTEMLIDTIQTTECQRVMYVDHTARWSGGEIALYRFITAMNQSRYKAVVVLGEDGPLAEKLYRAGVQTIIEPLDSGVRETRKDSLGVRGIARKLLFGGPALLSYAKKIASLAQQNQCQILHCNSLKSDIYGAIAGKMAKLPVIWHVRDHISPEYLPGMTVKTFREMARHFPTHVVCNSRSTLLSLFANDSAIANRLENIQRCTVISDCVDASFLQVAEPTERQVWRADGDNRPLTIAMIGRLARWKGQHVFLAAIKKMQEILSIDKRVPVPELRFVIAGGALFGEDKYETEIKVQAKRDLPDTNIEWQGNIGNVPELLKNIDVLVHASITPEPFGQVVIEGMAAGLPVIATNGGGVPEIIEEGRTGLLVPMGDAQALANALVNIIYNPRLATRMGREAWREVRSRFLPQRTAEEIETLYNRILMV